ncbi:26S protease regulatory subunit 6A [Listeria monocytogenes N53-1]|nr:26S protease regulatory subunit 6A [Listeria monocytogenes]CCQ23064.1 26S protease regulatory subunit 6A [Listeria monocytogenes N53-1]
MQPNQKQTVEIDVMNSSNEEIQVEAAINYASTNRTGVIDYTKNDLTKKDKSLEYPLPELAKFQTTKNS